MKAKNQLKAKRGHKTDSSASKKRAVASKAEHREEQMRRVNLHAGGIDCGAQEHYVAVPPESVKPGEPCVRCFSAFTDGLDTLVEWLKACGVTTAAMESTGVYWIPLYQKLEAAGIEVYLVNARHVRHVPGRKSDVQDCQWLQQLHSWGLLSASFRPEDMICRLRSLQRHRANMISVAASEIQHMQKALQQMNLHLHHVVSDINGVSGLRIIDAILAGERDPKKLAKLRDYRIRKSTPARMEAALVGDYRAEHLFVLGQSLHAYRFYQAQMEVCDREIETVLNQLAQRFESASHAEAGAPQPEQAARDPQREHRAQAQTQRRVKEKRKRKPRANEPKIDLCAYLERICGVDLTQVIGLNVMSVLLIVSEIGVDMSKWRSAKAFCSWLGLCPGNKISGGKVLDSRTRKVINRVATALRLAAQSVGRTNNTCLGIFYRRKKAHLGPAKATTATARKLACIVYHLLKYKDRYREPDPATYQLKLHNATLSKLQKQAAVIGYQLVPSALVAG
jgi:transposase